jgi:hypothetical protein
MQHLSMDKLIRMVISSALTDLCYDRAQDGFFQLLGFVWSLFLICALAFIVMSKDTINVKALFFAALVVITIPITLLWKPWVSAEEKYNKCMYEYLDS